MNTQQEKTELDRSIDTVHEYITKDPFFYTWNARGDDINLYLKPEVCDNIIFSFKNELGLNKFVLSGYISYARSMLVIDVPIVLFYHPPSMPTINIDSKVCKLSDNKLIPDLKKLMWHFNIYNMAVKQAHLSDDERYFNILKYVRPKWTAINAWSKDHDIQYNTLKRKHDIKKRMDTDPDSVTLGDISSIL